MHSLTRLLLAVLVVAVSGCLTPPGTPSCDDAACDAAGARHPLVPTWGVDDALQFQACQGGYAVMQGSYDLVRAVVPSAFRLEGYVPGTTGLLLQELSCERVASNTTVFGPASFAKFVAFVTPLNESWRAQETEYYDLGVFVSVGELADAIGPATGAEVARFQRTDGPTPAGRQELVTIEAADCSLSFSFFHGNPTSTLRSGTFHNWAGDGPFRRAEERQRFYVGDTPFVGVLAASGACTSVRAVGPGLAYTSQSYTLESVWTLVPQEYT